MTKNDVVIVGGGAAGLSAALVLSRARRKVLVVDAGAPRNAPAAHMQGFLSRDGLAPARLLAIGRDEVRSYGGKIISDAVADVRAGGPHEFDVALAGGARTSARSLLVSTGLRDELPDVTGLKDRWARDVLHCPYCHGWEVRDQRIGVLCDGSPQAVGYAHIVRQWTDDLVVLVPDRVLTADQRTQLAARGIRVIEGSPDEVLVERDKLTGLRLVDGRVVPRDVLFVPPRFVPNNDLLVQLGCELDAGWVVKDPTGRTSVPGVWVAGNVANARAQVVTAAGEGSAAAIAINADLVEDDVRIATSAAERHL